MSLCVKENMAINIRGSLLSVFLLIHWSTLTSQTVTHDISVTIPKPDRPHICLVSFLHFQYFSKNVKIMKVLSVLITEYIICTDFLVSNTINILI